MLHWIALYVKNIEITYFDSFGVEHVPEEIEKIIGHKNIKTNIFRIQANNSMCGYLWMCGLNEINEIKDYFNFEIQGRKITSKKLSESIAPFDYIDKTLIVLSATSGGISIISFTSVIGVPVGIASPSFSLVFSLTTRTMKKLLKITRNIYYI